MYTSVYFNSLVLTVAAFVGMSSAEAAEPASRPDFKQIIDAAEQTKAKLASTAASWTMVQEVEGAGEVRVRVHYSSTMIRYSITASVNGSRQPFGDIISRNGVWFVDDMGTKFKSRPYEAPMKNPNVYLFIERAMPHLADASLLQSNAVLESASDGVATFRCPLTEAIAKQLVTVLKNIERTTTRSLKENAPLPNKDKLLQTRFVIEEMLQRGIPMKVDLKNGLIVQSGNLGKRVWLRDFRWNVQSDADEFAVDAQKWADRTTPFAVDDPADLVAVRHCALWRPGQPTGALEPELLNIKNGDFRRVPYAGADCMPLCFSRDRGYLYVGGLVIDSATMGLFEINLKTQAQRRLGLPLLTTGFITAGALSPDGRTLAVAQGLAAANILKSQLVLVDVASGNAEKLGQPVDCGRFSWLPDGKGLVVLSRKYVRLDQPSEDTICRMDLDGHFTPLLKGDLPVVLAPHETILYHAQDKTWMTCGLDGRGARRVLDGLTDFNFPSPSPDGKRLLLMKFGGPDGPRPHVLDLSTGRNTPIDVEAGLWAFPIWR
jgi:hypothetical protein